LLCSLVMSTRGQRLRQAREKVFPSARAAAKALGIPVSTFGAHERAESPGGRDYGPDEASRYAKWLKTTPEYLLTGRSEPDPEAPDESRSATIRVVGYVGAGAEAHFYAVSQGDLDEVPAPEWATAHTVAVEIRGASLGPLFHGWLVYYDDVRQPPTVDLLGKTCVVGLDTGQILVKKVARGQARGTFDLISQNDEPIRGAVIEWAAEVKHVAKR
jgi:hypothetical protein